MAILELTIPGKPQAKERARRGRHGNFYTPEATEAYEDLVRFYAMRAMGGNPPMLGRLAVQARFSEAETWVRVEEILREKPRGRPPDLDNLLKSLIDGMQKKKTVFVNDNQVDRVEAERW